MAPADETTLDYYSRTATEYADATAAEADNPALTQFAAMLPPRGAVLDFGCGPGWAAAKFRDLGHEVTAMDAAVGFAEEARHRYGLDIQVARFEDLDAVAAFDGVWASFSLLHDTRAAMPGHLARIARALRPRGAVYIGLKEGTGDARDRLDRHYTYFTLDEITGLLSGAGFAEITHARDQTTGMDGVVADVLHLHARLV